MFVLKFFSKATFGFEFYLESDSQILRISFISRFVVVLEFIYGAPAGENEPFLKLSSKEF
jgi:hypothetical protein